MTHPDKQTPGTQAENISRSANKVKTKSARVLSPGEAGLAKILEAYASFFHTCIALSQPDILRDLHAELHMQPESQRSLARFREQMIALQDEVRALQSQLHREASQKRNPSFPRRLR